MKRTVLLLVACGCLSERGTFNDVYKAHFTSPYPARSAFAASGLALGARVEVECLAAAGK